MGYPLQYSWGSLVAQLVKNPPQWGRPGFDHWVGMTPWRRERPLTPVFWPGEFHGVYIVHWVTKSRRGLSNFHFTLQWQLWIHLSDHKKKSYTWTAWQVASLYFMISFLFFIFIFGMCVSSPISVLLIEKAKTEHTVDYRIGYCNIYHIVGGCMTNPVLGNWGLGIS